jgi:hypothetical protein
MSNITATIFDFPTKQSSSNYDMHYIDIFGKSYSTHDFKPVNLGAKMELNTPELQYDNPWKFSNPHIANKYELQAQAIADTFSKETYRNQNLEEIGDLEALNPFVKALMYKSSAKTSNNAPPVPPNSPTGLTDIMGNLSMPSSHSDYAHSSTEESGYVSNQTWVVNPKTGRQVKIGSNKHKQLIKQGVL